MPALNQTQSDALTIAVRNSTPLARLSFAEVQAVFAQMTALGFTIQAIGSTGGSYLSTSPFSASDIAAAGSAASSIDQDELPSSDVTIFLTDALRSTTAMSRLNRDEADAALTAIQTLGYPILRPASQGVG